MQHFAGKSGTRYFAGVKEDWENGKVREKGNSRATEWEKRRLGDKTENGRKGGWKDARVS